MEKQPIYVRMKRKKEVSIHTQIKVGDIAHLSGTKKELVVSVSDTWIYQVTEADREYAVIDSMQLMMLLHQQFPYEEWQLIGPTETVLHIIQPKKRGLMIKLVAAWMILFVGTAMTIMNFHYDVEMAEVHQKLHFLFTGETADHPLWLQIPYSFGLGIGMILFLNHWFKKRFNEEPSPLEIELFAYEQKVDQYLAYHENDLNDEDSSI